MKGKIKEISKKIKKPQNTQLATITNSTLEEERRAVLNNGKKFKYPVQYSKKKLVINTLIISAAIFIVGSIMFWYQLYVAQNTGSFTYRISAVLPLPVGRVDGRSVKYSDYLLEYRSTMFYTQKMKGALEVSGDEKTLSNQYKKAAMKNAINNAYVSKIAKEKGISVSNEEIEAIFKDHRTANGVEISEEVFNRTIANNYNMTPLEYRRLFIELPLLRQKVLVEIDSNAKNLKDQVSKILKENSNDFSKVAEILGEKVQVGKMGTVKTSNVDGGRTENALKLKIGEVSDPFVSKTGDGYYFVKLLSKSEKELSYEYIKISFTELESRIDSLEKAGKISKYIKIEE
jgi:hypothetical protein